MTPINEPQSSLLISGAGPVGLSFALALNDAPIKITVIDQKKAPNETLLLNDTRMIAVSDRACHFLQSLGLWHSLEPYATPMNTVHVSQKGTTSVVKMEAYQCGVENFGFLIPQGRMILAMMSQLQTQKNVTYLPETKINSFTAQKTSAHCVLQNNQQLNSHYFDWVVSAEGVESKLRMDAGIETYKRDYDQVAVIATATFEKPHNNTAYERFTSEGALALLPINTHEMAVVLIAPREKEHIWQGASDLTFTHEVLSRFGAELGNIHHPSPRHVWPLTLMIPKKILSDRLILIGNSAHGLHPIAGQGLNLGFRDSELLAPYFLSDTLPTIETLKSFEQCRKKDIIKVVGGTDFLVNIFDAPSTPLRLLRGAALFGIEHLPFLKKKIAQLGMGY